MGGLRRTSRPVVAAAPVAVDGIDPVRFLESSMARWLTGTPGYGAGNTSRGDFAIEDEYLMLGADSLFGGIGSGLDRRLWDGTPSGYEGLLAEGSGFLAVAIERWAVDSSG